MNKQNFFFPSERKPFGLELMFFHRKNTRTIFFPITYEFFHHKNHNIIENGYYANDVQVHENTNKEMKKNYVTIFLRFLRVLSKNRLQYSCKTFGMTNKKNLRYNRLQLHQTISKVFTHIFRIFGTYLTF